MSVILTDSMAREHVAAMQASAGTARRVREARQAKRDIRRAERRLQHGHDHPRAAAVGHAAARPFSAVRHWIVAGQL